MKSVIWEALKTMHFVSFKKKRLGTPCFNLLIFTHLLLFSEVCVEFGLRHNFTRMQGKQIREAILKIKS